MERKNTGKILNNSYKNADNLKGDEYEFSSVISVDIVGVDTFMKDSYDFDTILYNKMVDYVYEFIENNENIKSLTQFEWVNQGTKNSKESRNYSKEELNEIFYLLFEHLHNNKEFKKFLKMSYIFDIIAKITQVNHSNLFDSLDYENKTLVLTKFSDELDNDFTETNNFIY